MGILGRCVGYLWKEEPNKRDRILRMYIHHRNLYAKGQGELGILRNLISYQALLVTWLSADKFIEKIGWNVPMWMVFSVLAFLIICKILIQWLAGWWWDKNGVFDKELDWANKRNPIQRTISDRLLNGKGIDS